MSRLFDRVVIVGVGLIGSSLGMTIVRKRLAREVIGIGRDVTNLKVAMRKKAVHRIVKERPDVLDQYLKELQPGKI